MATKTITLDVPHTFIMPSYLLAASPEQKEYALLLADAILEKGSTMTQDTTIKHLHDTIQHLKATTVESCYEQAQRVSETKIRVQVIEKENQLRDKENHLEELRTQLDDYKRMLQELKLEKESINDKLRAKEEKVDELQEKLQQRIAIQSNSSKRGLEGERDFKTITNNFREWILESIGQKQKESTDFRSSIHSLEVRFEVKNHETLVPHLKNVDKFERDMREHQTTRVGVFVALTARIERMDDTITIRWTDKKQLLIYIPYFLTRDLAYTYDVIEGYIRLMKYMSPYFEEKDSSKDIQALLEKIEKTTETIKMLDKEICLAEKDHSDYTTKMNARFASLKSLALSVVSSFTGKLEESKPKVKKPRAKKELVDIGE
jgi:hypothetical protein